MNVLILLYYLFVLPYISTKRFPLTTYFFIKNDTYNPDWIINTIDNGYLVNCLKECDPNDKCVGIAVENLPEEFENNIRKYGNHTITCHTMNSVNIDDCSDGACDNVGYQLFQVRLWYSYKMCDFCLLKYTEISFRNNKLLISLPDLAI